MAWAATLFGSIPSLLLVAPLIRATFDGLSLNMTAPIMFLVVLFTEVLMPLWGPLIMQNPDRAPAREMIKRAQLQLQAEHA